MTLEEFKTECKRLIFEQSDSADLDMIQFNMDFVDTYAIDYYKTHTPKETIEEWNEQAKENYNDYI